MLTGDRRVAIIRLFCMLLLSLSGAALARSGVKCANRPANAARVTMIRPASIPPLIASDGSYDYVSDHGGYHSPGGRYLAEILGGDAVVRRLQVSRLIRRGDQIRRQVLFTGLESLNAIAWMPGMKDTLVASTGGEDNGVGLLADRRSRRLHRSAPTQVRPLAR